MSSSRSWLLNIMGDTPRTNKTDGQHNRINHLRSQIGHEMDQEFVECSFDNFMQAYMPFIPTQEDVDGCVRSMSTALVMKTNGDENFLDKFNEDTSKDSTEAAYFKPLEDIAEVIGRHPVQNRTCNYPYHDLHNKEVTCVIDGSTNRCDGYFKTGDVSTLQTTCIAVPCEYKRSSDASVVCENNIQVVSANVQIMNADVRRRFTFGMTIEGDELTLWYLSRSHSAVSKRENYVKNPKSLVKVFMSFMFAEPVEMGYDPDITLYRGEWWTYRMPPSDDGGSHRFYRTINSLSEYWSNNITGRMARIWLAAEVDSVDASIKKNTKQCVLKDVWLEKDAKTELEMQHDIFHNIREFLRPEARPNENSAFKQLYDDHCGLYKGGGYRKYFLTIMASSVGDLSKPLAASSLRKRNLFLDPALSLSYRPSASFKPGQSQPSRQGSGTPRPLESKQQRELARSFEQRKRYFVVFEEVCTTIGELRTFGEVLSVAAQTLIPLQLMFCAGWVHRDISSGNILAHKKDEWEVKLSDLEYAKKFPPAEGSKAHVDPKTGTPFFMPHEILTESYLYNPDNDDNGGEEDIFKQIAAHLQKSLLDTVSADVAPKAKAKAKVVHNFQHDLECLWWILLWTLTSRVPYENEEHTTFGCEVFQNTMQPSIPRQNAFRDPIAESLANILPPELFNFAEIMDYLRKTMYKNAMNRERDGLLFERGSYVAIHAYFYKALNTVVKYMEARPWATFKLESYSGYGNGPDPAPTGSMTTPDNNSRIPISATPHRVSNHSNNKQPRNKRRRDSAEYNPFQDNDKCDFKRAKTN